MFPTQYVYFEKKYFTSYCLINVTTTTSIFLNSHFLLPLFWKRAQLDHWTA